jgi:hypothetical protein
MGLTKSGYIEVYKYFDIGSCETYDRPLNPLDSYLRLRTQNESGAQKLRYILYGTPYEEITTTGPDGNTPQGTTVDHIINIPGGGYVQVGWDTVSPNQQLHRDSIYCPRKDTTLYLIKY